VKFGNQDNAKIPNTSLGATLSGNLKWNVFMTPGIPVVARELPPEIKEVYFQPTASTLIYGEHDAVLVDAFMTVKQANALADWVGASGKNLTTIYLTHGHGDHWFGIGALLEAPLELDDHLNSHSHTSSSLWLVHIPPQYCILFVQVAFFIRTITFRRRHIF
jgi:hypothetical protein